MGCGMKKAMVDVDLIKRLADTEIALLCLVQLAERIGQCKSAGATDCDSVATLLRMILDDFQNVVLRMQCEATESSDLQLLPGGAV